MFTQCPQCETVFRLSADVLGAAGGQVRCGRCGEVFDSLKRLSEEPRMFTIGETTLELEARAEQILESIEEEPSAQPEAGDESSESGPDTASLEIQQEPGEQDPAAPDFVVEVDRSLEFRLAPAELDRIFVEAEPGGPFVDEEAAAQEPRHSELQLTADELSVDELSVDELGVDELGVEELGVDRLSAEERLFVDIERPDDQSRGAAQAPAGEPEAGAAPWSAEMLLAPPPSARERRARTLWGIAAVILLLLLAAQIVHRNREWLASRPPFGALLRALYADIGNPLPVPASLSGYQLRQWGASGDATASGALRVRASILNTSSQMQPYPLLRVTLADRFGAHISSREFEPMEYVGKPVTRLLNPGERTDATVDIQDPGKNAEGFELDVCLRSADGRLRCASDAGPQPR